MESGQTVKLTKTVIDIKDKKKATVVVISVEGRDKDTGDLLFRIIETNFIKGIGGSGSKGKIEIDIPAAPSSAPDKEIEV